MEEDYEYSNELGKQGGKNPRKIPKFCINHERFSRTIEKISKMTPTHVGYQSDHKIQCCFQESKEDRKTIACGLLPSALARGNYASHLSVTLECASVTLRNVTAVVVPAETNEARPLQANRCLLGKAVGFPAQL